ncbi:DUF2628 domain-containing protein [Uliginosibacterium sp. TH139]|uniref:DUF2628 domain-containing protein n=1 Tax=Uliginosibacterium sp. TH139 TaxID=2067453 RepID=UPI000C7DDB9A|nr:DUF2628 domain-containing protein [Uliginosibacterium sp. TH139]PLK47805.1 hypothetical protein C0V76_15680 [Uliginosibacterium sp. TH139]
MQAHNPYATPRSDVGESSSNLELSEIESLPVSENWKERFRAISKAGGPKLPHLKGLSKQDRKNAISFNVLGFLFGPLYYVSKGMWKRGVSLLSLMVIVITVVELILDALGFGGLSKAAGYGACAVFAVRANTDYYKKMVLSDNGWW